MSEKNKYTPRFPRALYLAAGVLSLMILGLIYGWSLFKTPLQELFPMWSAADLSTGFTLLMGAYAAGSILAGFLSKWKRARLVFLLVAVLMLVGFWGASNMDPTDPNGSLACLYLTYCLLCGLGTGIGYNVCTTTIVKWFPDQSGFALGTLLMGYGLGALCMGSIVTTLNQHFGLLRTFSLMGIGVFAVLLFCSVFIVAPPEENKTARGEVCVAEESTYPSTAIKTTAFWAQAAWGVIVSAAFMIVISNAASIIGYYGAPAILGMVVSITNGVSRMISGSLMDRFGFHRISLIHNIEILISAGLMLWGGVSRSVAVLVLGLLLSGLGFGCTPTTQAYYLRRRFGPKYFSTIYSFIGPGLLLSSILGSSLSGLLQDCAPANEQYLTSFLLMAAFAVVGFILSFWLRRDVKF